MKEWKKPEIWELDVKNTECGPIVEQKSGTCSEVSYNWGWGWFFGWIPMWFAPKPKKKKKYF